MNLILRRDSYLPSGVFGELEPEDESFTLYTLEHAYPSEVTDLDITKYLPKIPPGEYTCKRGTHQLAPTESNTHPLPFITFEITNVPGHTNLLFHVGNFNKDSSGCILVGLFRSGDDSIMQSRAAFQKFMDSQVGCDEFTLLVG